MDFTQALQRLADHEELTPEQITFSIGKLTDGQLTTAQIAALLMALRSKGETVLEITEIARSLREKSIQIRPRVKPLVDTCGTGGDGSQTFNISTAAAFVVAGAGIPVAKHGNRSVSSRSGSADVLEQLDVNLKLAPQRVEQIIEEIGIGFLFAPSFHPAMRHASAPRKELGIRTVFNLLGPLLNPAGATHQIVGVYDSELTERVANVLSNLGVQSGMVVHGDGLDEIAISGPTKITQFHGGLIRTYEIRPEDVGFARADLGDIRCGSALESADLLLGLFHGQSGPHRDVVLLNAGAAIFVAEGAGSIAEGIERAAESIDSGAALAKLQALIEASRSEVAHGLLG